MSETARTPARWDRNRILFDIEEGGQSVPCAISREALQELSDRRYGKPQELMASFETLRPRVEVVARAKFLARSDAVDGLVIIWSSDLDDPEPEETPAA